MSGRGIRRLFALLIVMLLAFNAFATSYVISGYDFAIDGKTQKRVVRDLIIPDGEESFASEEELVAALDGKKQTLKNKRLFKSVEYEYTLSEEKDDTIFVNVRFLIRDAKTFLVVPYPKYDSNEGTTINFKVRDKNLFGTFATLEGDMSGLFRDGDWGNPELEGAFKITNLLVGDTLVTIDLDANGTWNSKDLSYNLGTTITNIPFLFGTNFNFNTKVKNVTKGDDNLLVESSATFNGVKVLGVGITPSVSSKIFTKAPGNNSFKPAVSVSGINLWGTSLGFSSSVEFINKIENEQSNYQPSVYTGTLNTSFGGKFLKGVSISSTVEYKPKTSIVSNNSLNYSLSDVTTLHLIENVNMNDKGEVGSFDTGAGISQRMQIGKYISITPKFCEYVTTTLTDSAPVYSRCYTFTASASGDNINWIDNYREGFAYHLSIDEKWSLSPHERISQGVWEHFDFTYFKLLWNWFNPSFRVIVNYQADKSGNGYIFGSDSQSEVGREVRGVLNNKISDNNVFALVTNINILTRFPMPKLFDFADYYASAFFDYALVKENDSSDFKKYYGFGVEGIGIFKEYPSYPIRLSIGLDLERFKAWLEDDGPSNFYEIYFGLDFFF